MLTKEIAILVNSCDSYSDIWDLFFEVLFKQWSDCPFKIYLNTETLSYHCHYFDVTVVNLPCEKQGKDISWSERLSLCLNRIEQKYILFTLDDIFFTKAIDTSDVKLLLQIISKIKKFGMLSCYNFGPKYYDSNTTLYRCHKLCEFNYNITCNLWNREYLLNLLSPDENIWQAESGIKKRMEAHVGMKEFCLPDDGIFQFDVNKYGLIQGKWAPKTQELLDCLSIKYDLTQRPIYIEDKSLRDTQRLSEWENRISKVMQYSKYPYIFYSLKNWKKITKIALNKLPDFSLWR